MAGKHDKVKDSERESILVPELKHCFICGSSDKIHLHEVFGGSNRAKSKEDKMIIALCPAHHNMSDQGIHFNKKLDDYVKQQAEKIWIDNYTDKDDTEEEKISKFIKRYGRNYL